MRVGALVTAALIVCSAVFADDLPIHEARENVVFLAPHPDDDALYSGTLLKALQAGSKVTVVYFSGGETPDYMARAYLKQLGLEMPKTAEARIAAYEAIREREAAEGLLAIEAAAHRHRNSGRETAGPGAIGLLGNLPENLPENLIDKKFLRLKSIPGTLASPEQARVTGELVQTLTRISNGEGVTVYVPHPRDTHPGHRATYSFLNQALEQLPPASLAHVGVYGYLVHYGKYAGELGLTHIASENVTRPPNTSLNFAFEPGTLESVPVGSKQAVVKLEALLSHQTQVSRDDVMKTGSPLLTGYLAGFVLQPEVLEKLPTDPSLMPRPESSLWKRVLEFAHRYTTPRIKRYSIDEREAALSELALASAQVLPERSRARAELEKALDKNVQLSIRGICERLLHGPWRFAGRAR